MIIIVLYYYYYAYDEGRFVFDDCERHLFAPYKSYRTGKRHRNLHHVERFGTIVGVVSDTNITTLIIISYYSIFSLSLKSVPNVLSSIDIG